MVNRKKRFYHSRFASHIFTIHYLPFTIHHSPFTIHMSELSELYQAVILDHNKKPRNFHKLAEANRSAEGFNPLCGDQLTVYLQLEGETLNDVSFEGSGCAISKAAASMMTQAVKGKSKQEAEILFSEF